MTQPEHDDTPLQIRCPSCAQRFKVGHELTGRMVECGACEHRFQITDKVIMRHRKFYPGERKPPSLSRYQRVPLAPSGQLIDPLYTNAPDPAMLEPASPQRIIAGIVGVSGMVLMTLLLMFGAGRGAILDGMPTANRLVMAGFTGFLGLVLLIYANPRGRVKAAFFGLLMAGGLLTVPLYFTEGSAPLKGDETIVIETPPPPSEEPVEDRISQLREKIGTKPLEDEIARLEKSGSGKKAMGLWLVDLLESNRLTVRDYLLRVTGADPGSHIYPRDGGNYLMVITGVDLSLEELAMLASSLGQSRELHSEVDVVEVRVDNEVFVEGPIEKLRNREDPAFYELNKRELEAIELTRVARAVQRLAEAEPKLYRADITRRLISLLDEKGVDFQGSIARALSVWSDQPGVAGAAAAATVKRLFESGESVPPELMALAVKEGVGEVIPVLDELWFASPTTWETMYADLGPVIEPTVIRRFPETSGPLRQSAVRLLGRVGGVQSVPVLNAAADGADAEMAVLIQQALASIKSRQ
jgi:hypothetical protein